MVRGWVLWLAICGLVLGAGAAMAVIADSFGNLGVSKLLWKPELKGTGVHVAEATGVLRVTVDANAKDAPGGIFRAGYVSTGKLTGDFDIQVNYRLVQWPKGSGIRMGLGTTTGTVERKSWGNEGPTGREDYGTNIGPAAVMDFWMDNAVHLTPAQGRSGALRLVRKDDQQAGYYLDDGKWVMIGSGTVPKDDVSFALLAWGHNDRFTNKKVVVTFDNFRVNAGTLVLPSQAPKGPASRKDQ